MRKLNLRNQKNVLTICLLFILFGAAVAVAGADQRSLSKKQSIAAEKIRSAVRQFILRQAPWNAEQMTLQKIKYNRPLALPAGKVSLYVSAPKHTDWLGAVPFTVAAVVNGQKAARITVPVNIQVWSDIILTTKPLGKFQPIDRDDIQVKKMDLARVPSNVLVDIEQVLGRRTNRNIAGNCILRSDHVEFPPIIKRGDLVQVVAETSNLKISVKALAKQNGRKGERIKVMNLRSKKAIYALVVDDQTVQVDF